MSIVIVRKGLFPFCQNICANFPVPRQKECFVINSSKFFRFFHCRTNVSLLFDLLFMQDSSKKYRITMFSWNAILLASCLIISALCVHIPEKDKLEDLLKQREAAKSEGKQEGTVTKILGYFEPSEEYFTSQQQSEKREWRRRFLRCIRFDWYARRCRRFAIVGIWN